MNNHSAQSLAAVEIFPWSDEGIRHAIGTAMLYDPCPMDSLALVIPFRNAFNSIYPKEENTPAPLIKIGEIFHVACYGNEDVKEGMVELRTYSDIKNKPGEYFTLAVFDLKESNDHPIPDPREPGE